MNENDIGRNIAVVIAVAVIGVLFVCCLIGVGSFLFLGLMGPSVGTVFSNIVTNLPTPTP